MKKAPKKWDLETEVLAVGSGASGLSAALTAVDHGAKTTVIEKTSTIGGTTAMGGGGMWIPNSHYNVERGVEDSKEKAFGYCKLLTANRASEELIHAYLDTAPEMLKYMEETCGLKVEVSTMPDYHPQLPGGHDAANSRTLIPDLFCRDELGEHADNLRRNPHLGIPARFSELDGWNYTGEPQNIDFTLLAKRMEENMCGMGEALIGYLYKGCLDRKVDFHLNTPLKSLVVDGKKVVGVCAEKDGKDFYIKASKGVVIGAGGFEWNEELKQSFLYGPITHMNSCPANEGDALKACISIGTALGNMSETWGWVSTAIPGEEYEGKPLSRGILPERTLPHQIIVNKRGKRFVNEAANYNSMFKALWEVEENSMALRNHPCWSILDSQYRNKYGFATVMPGDPTPPWWISADSLEELAKKVGIDPAGLVKTVADWNQYVADAKDPDYNRGSSVYDALWGDKKAKPNPTMGTIKEAPYYAIPLYHGTLGTCGGPRTNANSEVLHVNGYVIEGLYAAGNFMASVTGNSYWGGGATIGPCLVFGYIAGRHAAAKA